MSSFAEKAKHEVRELIPVTVFFFVAFQLLALTEALMLRQYGISVSVFLTATLLALVVAKVVVIADHFAVVNRYPEKPLAYNVVWKTAIYFVAALLARYAEHLVRFWRKTGNLTDAHRQLVTDIVWPRFWLVQLWLLVLLLVYCASRELVRALGRDRVVRMFFHDLNQDLPIEGGSK